MNDLVQRAEQCSTMTSALAQPDAWMPSLDTSYLDPLRKSIEQAPVCLPPAPWVLTGHYCVAGLEDVGFDRDRDLLLVCSSSGLGVFDCRTGEKLAREYDATRATDQYHECTGIGPLSGCTLRMAGISGGGLPNATADGWCVEAIPVRWPVSQLLLVEPGSWLFGAAYGKPANFHKLAEEPELRAFGFSWSGRSLVIAGSGELMLFSRA
ncbi:hypothetical protein [Pseudomonas peradeniyensis]|uniref:hypothetical protein n=1 Tax=Pseudomonas peradeniyensis TaxID=2745488 RepID=UPI001CEDF23F|nr:hypothetical protein [Pseudomonas peradeniyensis]